MIRKHGMSMKTKNAKRDAKVTVDKPARRKRRDVQAVPVQELQPLALVKGPAAMQRERMATFKARRPKVDDTFKARFLALMRAGEWPTDICDDTSMPPYSAFRQAMAEDETFAADFEEAFRVMADQSLCDASKFARESAETGNVDLMRIADIYAKSLNSALEKLAPRDYGALIKHAGAEGGPLQVQVISYAKQLDK